MSPADLTTNSEFSEPTNPKQKALQYLDRQKQLGLIRKLKFQNNQLTLKGPWTYFGERKILNLTSNDYLNLSHHPHLIESVKSASSMGIGAGASRLLGGGFEIHHHLEQRLAQIHRSENCLVMGSGFGANQGILLALGTIFKNVIADKYVHASMIDGARSGSLPLTRFKHNDLEHLESILKKIPDPQNSLILSESLFSMDGDWFDFAAFQFLQEKYGFTLYIDEAHSFGGYPLIHQKIHAFDPEKTFVLGTFGKALGSMGSFFCGPEWVIQYLIQSCRSFIYSTALSPLMVHAVNAALDLVESAQSPHFELPRQFKSMKVLFKKIFHQDKDVQSHIVPIVLGENELALKWSEKLWDEGVYIGAVRPPTVPVGTARLRLSLCAGLEEADWIFLEQAFHKVAQELEFKS